MSTTLCTVVREVLSDNSSTWSVELQAAGGLVTIGAIDQAHAEAIAQVLEGGAAFAHVDDYADVSA